MSFFDFSPPDNATQQFRMSSSFWIFCKSSTYRAILQCQNHLCLACRQFPESAVAPSYDHHEMVDAKVLKAFSLSMQWPKAGFLIRHAHGLGSPAALQLRRDSAWLCASVSPETLRLPRRCVYQAQLLICDACGFKLGRRMQVNISRFL
jgi:hypothetical protein